MSARLRNADVGGCAAGGECYRNGQEMQARSPAESRAEGALREMMQLRELGAVEYDSLMQGNDHLNTRGRLQQRREQTAGARASRKLEWCGEWLRA